MPLINLDKANDFIALFPLASIYATIIFNIIQLMQKTTNFQNRKIILCKMNITAKDD